RSPTRRSGSRRPCGPISGDASSCRRSSTTRSGSGATAASAPSRNRSACRPARSPPDARRESVPGSAMKRVLSAVVFLPVFWLIVKKLKPGVYEGLIAVGALLALWELYRFAAARGQRCHRLIGAIVALLIMASFAFRTVDIRYALAIGLIALPLASLWRGGEWGPALADTSTSFFVATFVGVLFGYLIDLRTMSDLPKGLETGSDLVFLLFFVV